MGYVRLIKAETGYDKEIALWEQMHMIPETIEYWEGESIESIINYAEDQFGELDGEWDAKPFDGGKSHYHAVFSFSLPIKYWQEVKI